MEFYSMSLGLFISQVMDMEETKIPTENGDKTVEKAEFLKYHIRKYLGGYYAQGLTYADVTCVAEGILISNLPDEWEEIINQAF